MPTSTPRIIRIILTVIVLAAAVYIASSRTVFVMCIIFPMFTLTLASMIIVLFSVRPRRDDAIFVVGLTILHGVVAFMLMYLPYHGILWLAYAGLSSFWILCARAIWSKDSERKVLAFAAISAILLLTVESGAASVLTWTERMHPKTLDLFLYSFDGSLGTQISFQMGMAFVKWPLFRSVALFFYDGLPLGVALLCAQHIAARTGKALSAVTALVCTGPIGVVFYNLLPALGPRLIPQLQFPFHGMSRTQTMNMALVEIAAHGPRNAIPSLHMAWVLLIWWYSRGLSWWVRAVAILFLVFTVAATIGTGEHYFVDLVVGVPFAVFVESLFSFDVSLSDRRRIVPLTWGLGATLAWLALLRFEPKMFWISPIIPWGLIAATVTLSWIWESGLHSEVVSPQKLYFGLGRAELAAAGSTPKSQTK
jgi:hypothetical protein